MEEILDKYIRKHIRIEGKVLYIPTINFGVFNEQVRTIFGIRGFSLDEWIEGEIGKEFVVIFKGEIINHFNHINGRYVIKALDKVRLDLFKRNGRTDL